MELDEALLTRTSVRRFKSDDISEAELRRLMELANAAPSAGNVQARDFIVVRKQSTKDALAEAALGQDFINEAPVVVVVCGNKERSSRYYGKRGSSLYYIQDADAAVQNLLLAVHGAGYGACWVGAFDEKEVSTILKLPATIRPLAIIPIGIPARPPKKKEKPNRIDINKLTHNEKW
jgi:nitroreductase